MRLSVRTIAAAVLASLGTAALLAASTGAAAPSEKDYTADLRQISKKLDEVLASQKEFMSLTETRHATLMEELRIVKVRSFQAR